MDAVITTAEGYRLLDWGGGRRLIWMESARLDACMKYYREHNLAGVAVCPSLGYSLADIGFVKAHPYITGLVLLDSGEIDISAASWLAGLRFVSISDNRQEMDFAQFAQLEEIHCEWHAGIHIDEACRSLRELDLRSYRPKGGTVEELPTLALRVLRLIRANIVSLAGVSRFRELRHLELSYCLHLNTLGPLKLGHLEELDCLCCKNIRDHASVATLSALRVLRFNRCGEIPSIDFVRHMPQLRDFRFVGTDVIDGDMSACLRLESVGFTNKRHFSLTMEQVNEAIAAKSKSCKRGR